MGDSEKMVIVAPFVVSMKLGEGVPVPVAVGEIVPCVRIVDIVAVTVTVVVVVVAATPIGQFDGQSI